MEVGESLDKAESGNAVLWITTAESSEYSLSISIL